MISTVPSDTQPDYFSRATSTLLKAIAIVFLISGHFSIFCLPGKSILNRDGELAVSIFLIVSAMGLTKTYGLDGCGNKFLFKRLAKITFPLWLTFGIFFGLDFIFLHKTYSLGHIVSRFAGIIPEAPPNGPAWFISFILYLYLIFFLVSNLPMPRYLKCIAFFSILFGTSILISRVPLLSRLFGKWNIYIFIFPISICIMAYGKVVARPLHWLHNRFKFGLIAASVTLMLLYFTLNSGRTILFIAFIAIAIVFIDRIKSVPKVLTFLGDHSFELYLLHFPLLVSYGLVIGRKPLACYFLLYLVLIITASFVLRKVGGYVNRIVFRSAAE